MSLQTHPASSQAVRQGDRRHAASVARQRQHATASPRAQGEAIAKIIRKKISDQLPVPDLDRYGLTDQVWAELLDILTPDELSAVGDVAGADDLADSDNEPTANDVTMAFRDVPLMPEPPAPQQTPHVSHGWRQPCDTCGSQCDLDGCRRAQPHALCSW